MTMVKSSKANHNLILFFAALFAGFDLSQPIGIILNRTGNRKEFEA